MRKIKVLFVCLGNICRSPLAEAIFKNRVNGQNLTEYFEIDSCGTANYHVGDTPDERTISNARGNGIEIDHLGRQLSERDLAHYDIILAMDKSNYANILRLDNQGLYKSKVKLMREFDSENSNTEVPDPYYGGPKGFQEVFEILDRSTNGLLKHLQKSMLNP